MFDVWRYHGVLAPNAACREQIVPGCCAECDEDGADTTCSHGDLAPTPEPSKPSYRLSWVRLLARVFRIDACRECPTGFIGRVYRTVTECPHCGGRMKIIALLPEGQALTEPAAIRAYLDGVGLDSHPPPVAPAFSDHPE